MWDECSWRANGRTDERARARKGTMTKAKWISNISKSMAKKYRLQNTVKISWMTWNKGNPMHKINIAERYCSSLGRLFWSIVGSNEQIPFLKWENEKEKKNRFQIFRSCFECHSIYCHIHPYSRVRSVPSIWLVKLKKKEEAKRAIACSAVLAIWMDLREQRFLWHSFLISFWAWDLGSRWPDESVSILTLFTLCKVISFIETHIGAHKLIAMKQK